jgi:NAD(P)H-nitrite reductase large subunit
MLTADAAPPCDRPNLSKGYLAGTVPPEYTLLRPAEFYKEHRIELKLGVRVTNIDTSARQLALADGSRVEFGALLLATGADVVRLDLPGSNLPHVHYLRTLADCDSLIAKAATSKRAVVVGASFIGLEVTPPFALGTSRCTSSLPIRSRCRRSWARTWERSSAPFTKSTE